jgi:Uma2 family endonuclease
MAASPAVTYVPLDEYLHTSYRPDVDYVDDHIEERNLGEFDHGDLQAEIVSFFRIRGREWNIRAVTDVRVQVRERNFRVPDVCLTDASLPRERIIRQPPFLCIEILSPEDTMKRTRVRAQDFLRMGVPQVWIFDPEKRTVTVSSPAGESTHTSGTLRLPETPIYLEIDAAFRTLDDA